ncbi:MAG TPA: SRPBCC family protein [Candidatus Limnocylindria bacterium]|jgi:uncharacterized protein YndB with AHSA1/START domain
MTDRVVVEQEIAASPSRVFEALTDAEQLARWWWPHMPDTRYQTDARVGGAYLIESDDVGIGVRGTYTEMVPGRVIGFTWIWLTRGVPHVEEPVRVTLEPSAAGTRLTLVHELEDVDDHAANIRIGWEDVLGRLAGLFAPVDERA